MIALLVGCVHDVSYGGGSLTIDLDDRDNSGLRMLWTIDGLGLDAMASSEELEGPFLFDDNAGEANGAFLRDTENGVFLRARASAHHPELGDLVEIDDAGRPECAEQVGAIAFNYTVARHLGVIDRDSGSMFLRLDRSDLPSEGGYAALEEPFAEVAILTVNQDVELVRASRPEGELVTGNVSWLQDRGDPCWADWDARIHVVWAFDEDGFVRD